MKKDSLLTKIRRKLCRHSLKFDHEEVTTLSTGDVVVNRTFYCEKCGKKETYQYIHSWKK